MPRARLFAKQSLATAGSDHHCDYCCSVGVRIAETTIFAFADRPVKAYRVPTHVQNASRAGPLHQYSGWSLTDSRNSLSDPPVWYPC